MKSSLRFKWLLIFLVISGSIHAQSWQPLTDANDPRWFPSGVLLGEKLYVLSGFISVGGHNEIISPSFEVYDIPTDSWSPLTPMPVSKYESDTSEAGVTHTGVELVGDTIWVVGGRTGNHPGPITEEVWLYDTKADHWFPGPDLPVPIATGNVINAARTLHYIGGFFNACNGAVHQYHFTLDVDAWLADPVNVTWENDRKPLPRPRSHLSAAFLAGKIYVYGGEDGHDCCSPGIPCGIDLTKVDVYDIATDTWAILPDLPYKRSHAEMNSFALDGKIYQVGSEVNPTISKTTLVYDPALNSWYEETGWEFPEFIMMPAVGIYRDSLIISHGGYPGRADPKTTTQYTSITRSPVYDLGWEKDTLEFWVYQGLSAEEKIMLWTKSGSLEAAVLPESPASWLSAPQDVELDMSGKRIKISANSGGLASGTYFAKLILSGTGEDVVNPADIINFEPDTLVIKMTIGPSPDGVLLLDQPEICEKVEVGTTHTFPVDMITPGSSAISLASTSFSNPTRFSLNGTLPASLPANSSDQLFVSFTPDSAGPFTTDFSLIHGGVNGQTDITLTCDAIPPCEVPADWINTDIGTPSLAGAACETGGTYRITAGGNNIWSTSDQAHYLATRVTGDGDMIIKVNWVTEEDEDTKVGVMLRESLDANSPNAFLCINPNKAFKLQSRLDTGLPTNKAEVRGFYPPHYLKLERQGDVFTAWHSEDGSSWVQIINGGNPATIVMSDTLYAGIALTSHNISALAEAEIEDVTINFNQLVFPVELEAFSAKMVESAVKLQWKASNEQNFSHYEIQRKTTKNAEFHPVTIVQAQGKSRYEAWDAKPEAGSNIYRLAMHDIDGQINYSSQIEVYVDRIQPFKVYKKAGMQALELNWFGPATDANIRLLDITGKEIWSKQAALSENSKHLLAVPSLSTGYYMVELVWDVDEVGRKLLYMD